jgi:hypothetical protein
LILFILVPVFLGGCGDEHKLSSQSSPTPAPVSTSSSLIDVESVFRSYYFESEYILSSSAYLGVKDYVNAYHVFSKDIYTRFYNRVDLDEVETTLSTDETMFVHLLGNVGYISFDRFVEGTANRVSLAVKSLVNSGAGSLILDLRLNGGGFPGECSQLADFFTVRFSSPFPIYSTISSGSMDGTNSTFTLGTTGNQHGHEQYFDSSNMVVLTSALTASAAEIFVAALKYYGESIVIGSNTFGKSRMVFFNRMDTSDGYEMTVSRIIHADGVDREGSGISPDVETSAPFTEAFRRLSGYQAWIPEDPLVSDFGLNAAALPLMYDQAYWRSDQYQAAFKALCPGIRILEPGSMCEGFFPGVKRR